MNAKTAIISAVVALLVASNVWQYKVSKDHKQEAVAAQQIIESERLLAEHINVARQVTQSVLNSRISQLGSDLQVALKKAKQVAPSLKPTHIETGDSGEIKPSTPGTGTPSEKCLFAEGDSGRITYERVQGDTKLGNTAVLVHAKSLNATRGNAKLFEADLKVDLEVVAPAPIVPQTSLGFIGGYGISVGPVYGLTGSKEIGSLSLPLIGTIRATAGVSMLTGPQMPFMALGSLSLGR
jgi:hypothetical protein